MKFYAAALSEWETLAPTSQPPYNLLLSYHYFRNKADVIKSYVSKGYDVFVDSGAFSAENSGKQIDIDEYCKFVIGTTAPIYAGLDVIGDARRTMINIKLMEERYGLNPIPTFHLGGDLKDLYSILHYPYIALGGLVFSSNITRYCDEVWSIILKETPKIRVHGFGMTNIELMERYPWYSVDSSSYKGCRRYGRQQILWNGFEWKTFQEEEFYEWMKNVNGIDCKAMENRQRWFILDYWSVQSYKIFAEHLNEVNKLKDFSYLTGQLKFF